MYLPYVVCLLVAVSVVYSDVLKECQTSECPEYEVVEKKEHYEIRKYPAYKAAVVQHTGLSFIKARQKNFFKLYRYQQGGNNKQHSFPMVYPFVTLFTVMKWKSGDEEKEEVLDKDFKMAYFIPKALHDDPPKSTIEKDDIVIADSPERTLYAVSFPGHATSWKVKELQQKLKADLLADGVDFDHSLFGVMEYNKWNQLWGRHNDVVYSSKVNTSSNSSTSYPSFSPAPVMHFHNCNVYFDGRKPEDGKPINKPRKRLRIYSSDKGYLILVIQFIVIKPFKKISVNE